MLNLPTKKLQKQMPIDHKLCLQYMKIGKNCEQFKQDMLTTIRNSIINKSKSPKLPEIKQHLKLLIYDGFIKDIPLSQLKHIPRYLKAIQIRLTRLEHDPQKDARKAEQMANLWRKYLKSPKAEVKWMLEELRVSLFAPELKTAYPVSVQRVERMFG